MTTARLLAVSGGVPPSAKARLLRVSGGTTLPVPVKARVLRVTGATTVPDPVRARLRRITGSAQPKRVFQTGETPISAVKLGLAPIDRMVLGGKVLFGTPLPTPSTTEAWDWSDTNVPWSFSDPAVLRTGWPSGVVVVDLQTDSPDFYTNLSNTVAAAGQRVVVRLKPGRYSLNAFRLIGSSGSPTYAFGFWFPNLQGFICESGAGQASIEMAANSTTQAQLDDMKTMASDANGRPNLMVG